MKKLFLFMTFLTGMTMTAGAQTASDEYLDVAQYSTIDAAGWSQEYLDNLYLYNEYEDAGVAWLNLAISGAYFNSADWGSAKPDRGQKWITLNPNPNTTGHKNLTHDTKPQYYAWTNSRSATSPMCGSQSFFGENQVYVYGSSSGTTRQTISFYVTNVDQVKILKKLSSTTSTNKAHIITVSEYVKNAQGTLVYSSQVDQQSYTNTSLDGSYTSPNLDVSKIYRIECSTVIGNFREIAFRTPLNPAVITADPTSLSFSSTINTPVTKTVNVKGVNLKDVINATVTNTTGNAFSINGSSSVSIADASSNDGGEISVTFNPDAEGNYAGTLILTTTSAQNVEIPLSGEATSRMFTVNISSVGLTTLYLDEPLQIPYDKYDPDLLGVFYIYAMNGSEMRAARLNNTIPANTAVIIQGNSGSYDFPVISEADPLPSSRPNSYLSGCLENTAVADVIAATPGTIYTLGKGSDHYINFYKYTGTTLNANKAYYLLPSGNSAKALTLSFDDAESEVTGINTVGAKAENGAWYSIQGVQLQSKPATKGIYIHNGKAVIVK